MDLVLSSFQLLPVECALELERVPDLARRPKPEEKLTVNSTLPDTSRAQISTKTASFMLGSTGLERMWDVLGSSKSQRI